MIFNHLTGVFTLAAVVSAASYKRVTCPDGKHTATNEACCVFFDLADNLKENLFGTACGETTHQAVRVTFHDAMGFSGSGKFQGNGADGSIITFQEIELAFVDNLGIDDSVFELSPFLQRFPTVTPGDLIQFAGAVAVGTCAGGPRLQFLAGRPNATIPASSGTVPGPADSVTTILERVTDAGLTSNDLIHWLASHSIARVSHVDPTLNDVPLDSTPSIFDTQFFLEVLLKGVGFPGISGNPGEALSPLPDKEMRLESDMLLSRDPRTACTWQSMVNNQQLMMESFKDAMAKIAVIGQDVDKLIDCSEAVPVPVPPVQPSATFPVGTGPQDVQKACPLPLPPIPTAAQ